MKILTVIGNRPQFVKAAAVSVRLREAEEVVVHTGQHYDRELSDVFFEELELERPAYQLNVGSGSHAEQTARIMTRLEPVILEVGPDALLVYGSKAFPNVAVQRLLAEEGFGADVASLGERELARRAGVPGERGVVHGNNKTDAESRHRSTDPGTRTSTCHTWGNSSHP